MNWIRAKNILIILFILINSILLGIIINTMSTDKKSKQIERYTISILKDRNWEVLCDIPSENLKMSTIKVSGINRQMLYDKFTIKNVNITSKTRNVEKVLWDIIKKSSTNKKIPMKEYIFNKMDTSNNETKLFYNQKFGDGIIFDNYVRATIYSDKVNVDINYQEMEYMEEKRDVIDISQVLLKNFTKSEKKISIIYIKAGYIEKQLKVKNGEVLYVPVWNVITSDGKTKYYKVFTGEEIIN